MADKVTALNAAQAVTAALFARDRGSGGQHVELAMLDAVVSFLWVDGAGSDVLPDAPPGQPSNVGSPRPLRFLDGWGVVTPTGDADFAGMCRAFGVDGHDDPRVATAPARVQHRDVTREFVVRCYKAATSMTLAEGMARLSSSNIPSISSAISFSSTSIAQPA
jgi:crotonobetainyl-CoA:carnitine CoA-transferase CaiB-like acyl-CoA transferase